MLIKIFIKKYRDRRSRREKRICRGLKLEKGK